MSKLRCDRLRISSGQRLAVEPALLGDKVHVSLVDSKVTASIADLGAHRTRGGQIARRLSWRRADQHALGRASLQPDQCLAVTIPLHV